MFCAQSAQIWNSKWRWSDHYYVFWPQRNRACHTPRKKMGEPCADYVLVARETGTDGFIEEREIPLFNAP
jgi:hypothetical protein